MGEKKDTNKRNNCSKNYICTAFSVRNSKLKMCSFKSNSKQLMKYKPMENFKSLCKLEFIKAHLSKAWLSGRVSAASCIHELAATLRSRRCELSFHRWGFAGCTHPVCHCFWCFWNVSTLWLFPSAQIQVLCFSDLGNSNGKKERKRKAAENPLKVVETILTPTPLLRMAHTLWARCVSNTDQQICAFPSVGIYWMTIPSIISVAGNPAYIANLQHLHCLLLILITNVNSPNRQHRVISEQNVAYRRMQAKRAATEFKRFLKTGW